MITESIVKALQARMQSANGANCHPFINEFTKGFFALKFYRNPPKPFFRIAIIWTTERFLHFLKNEKNKSTF